MVVGQTTTSNFKEYKMLADGQIDGTGIVILLAMYGIYRLFPVILKWIEENT